MTTALHPCPKCQTPMRTIERSGIHLETCPDCRGIFLDRGELDRLLDLEAATLARRDAVGPGSMPAGVGHPSEPGGAWRAADGGWLPGDRVRSAPGPGWDRPRRDRDDDDDDWDDRRRWDRDRDRDDRYDGGRRRRGGFLSELLEGLGD